MKDDQSGYRKRAFDQVEKWANGISEHNTVDDECCPDFSCCNKTMDTPLEMRKVYFAAHKKHDHKTTEGMLMGFLGEAISKHKPELKVHITNGDHSHNDN